MSVAPIEDPTSSSLLEEPLLRSGSGLDAETIDVLRSIVNDAGGPPSPSINQRQRLTVIRLRSLLAKRAIEKQTSREERGEDSCASEFPIVEDVYNMFFLSENWSLPFWYSLYAFANKLILYGIVMYWIYRPGGWCDQQKKEHWEEGVVTLPVVQLTQFLLIPTAIGITEELILTLNALGKTGWTQIEQKPQATRMKYFVAKGFRALDGLTWLLIITTLMLFATDILNMFLNFAALQFLQSIDDTFYNAAKEGFFGLRLELAAAEVAATTLPTKRGTWREYINTAVLLALLVVMTFAWAAVNFHLY